MAKLRSDLIRYLPSVGAFLITAAYLATAYTYKPAPRAMPVLIGWSVLVLLGLDILSLSPTVMGRQLTAWLNPARNDQRRAGLVPHRQWIALGSLGALTLGFVLLGVLVACGLYVFLMAALFGRRSLLTALIAAAAVTCFVWLMFVQFLHVELYPGLLFVHVFHISE
jgi:hypothetical protein